jgi:hypothetical protein
MKKTNFGLLAEKISKLSFDLQKEWKYFFDWLRANQIFEKWKNNLNSCVDVNIEGLEYGPEEAISGAFNWENTKEGKDFWEEYDILWTKKDKQFTQQEAEEMFNKHLDEMYPDYEIGNLSFKPSTILKKCDPIAYKIMLSEFADERNFVIV